MVLYTAATSMGVTSQAPSANDSELGRALRMPSRRAMLITAGTPTCVRPVAVLAPVSRQPFGRIERRRKEEDTSVHEWRPSECVIHRRMANCRAATNPNLSSNLRPQPSS